VTALPPVGALLEWVHDGQSLLEKAISGLAPDAVPAPSTLPGWTRGHLLTHLARNADALVNLLIWARTGTRTPMYSSPEQRAADIEAGAGRGLAEQADDLRASARRFTAAAAALPADRWSATVASAQGREIPASEVPWLRVREVWIHLVDLDVGYRMGVLPPELALTLVRDVAAWLTAKTGQPVEPRVDGVLFGQVLVTGAPNRLAGWLTGRDSPDGLRADGEMPKLPRWL
jgi:maleylpyruvate isomerase